MKSLLHTIYYFLVTAFWALRLGRGFYYVCSRGIGDTLIFLSRLRSYYLKNNEKVNILICLNHFKLVPHYSDYIGKCYFCNSKTIRIITEMTWNKNRFRRKFSFILPPYALDLLDSGENLFSLVGKTLNLADENFDRPIFNINRERIDYLEKTFGIGLKKFVFVAFEAVSVDVDYDNDFRRKLVDYYRNMGFYVIENMSPQSPIVYGDMRCFLDLDETYYLASKAERMIMSRSGLSDMMSFLGNKMIVIYDSVEDLRRFSFKNMPFSKHVIEFSCDTKWEECISEL